MSKSSQKLSGELNTALEINHNSSRRDTPKFEDQNHFYADTADKELMHHKEGKSNKFANLQIQ